MSPKELRHFLLVFDIERGSADVEEFERDYDAAIAAYSAREGEYNDDPNVEVVLLSSDSLQTIKKTHGSYFGDAETHLDDVVSRELEAVEAEAAVD